MELYPYQQKSVEFLKIKGTAMVGHEVGLGKTLIALSVLANAKKENRPHKTLVLCPAILKLQWKSEQEKFFPEFKSVVITGNAEERARLWLARADIYIANYELLQRDFNFAGGTVWDYVICDEATRISNPRTKTYKILSKLKSVNRLAMTGTPLNNRVQDIYGIINWLKPGYLGNYYAFLNRYCVKNYWGSVVGYVNLEELRKRIRPLITRKTKEEVLPELPDKIISEVPFELSEEERMLYDKITKELLFEIEQADISKVENPITIQATITKMLRLRQLTGSMELLGEKNKSSKLDVLKELLPMALEGEKKAIIFTFFSKMADILERELAVYKPLKITGSVNHREDIIEEFNNNASRQILLMTSAGQYGLNIQIASVVIHYDNEWSIAKMEQREGRAHRINQKNNVLVYHLIARKTMDEYIKKVLYKKQKLANQLLGEQIGVKEIKEILTYGIQ